MARRASGASAMHVPGVADAVARYLRAFAAKWDSRSTLADLDALARWELAVSGDQIWRATFDPGRPHEGDKFLGDASMWLVTGPNTLEAA